MGRRSYSDETLRRERFDSLLTPEPMTGCWLWIGATSDKGYGKFGINYRTWVAPRVSWELHRGPIPDGMFACHHCDTPACVNPDHLFLGTVVDNCRDMTTRGRSARGERNSGAKLTPTQVDEIRQRLTEGASTTALATEFVVSRDAIARIGQGETWRHLASRPPLTPHPRLCEGAVEEIRRRIELGEPRAAIAAAFGVNRKTVFNIGTGRTRKEASHF